MVRKMMVDKADEEGDKEQSGKQKPIAKRKWGKK